jgi:hypothetical protein
MSIAAIARALKKAGCTSDQIIAGIEAAEEEQQEGILARREKARLKKQAQRESKKNNEINSRVLGTDRDRPGQTGTDRDIEPPYKEGVGAPAPAPAISNGSSLRSEPINLEEKLKPSVLSKKSEAEKILLECLCDETAMDLMAHRKAKKSPMTAGAAKGLVKAFRAFGDPEAAAREMMAQGWTGFNPEWMANLSRAGPAKPYQPLTNPAAKIMRELAEKSDARQQFSDNPGGAAASPGVPRTVGLEDLFRGEVGAGSTRRVLDLVAEPSDAGTSYRFGRAAE